MKIHDPGNRIRSNPVTRLPLGFFNALTTILVVDFIIKILLYTLLSSYLLFPKYFTNISHTIKEMELVPILMIEYASIVLFWYSLSRWGKALDEGRMTWFFRMGLWIRIFIIVILAGITAATYYPFSKILLHAGLSGPGPGHPLIMSIQQIMVFLILFPTVFFRSLVWLWWFKSQVKSIRFLVLSICSWFIYDSIVMSILRDTIVKQSVSDISRHLQNNMMTDAKIGIIALAVFMLIQNSMQRYKSMKQSTVNP